MKHNFSGVFEGEVRLPEEAESSCSEMKMKVIRKEEEEAFHFTEKNITQQNTLMTNKISDKDTESDSIYIEMSGSEDEMKGESEASEILGLYEKSEDILKHGELRKRKKPVQKNIPKNIGKKIISDLYKVLKKSKHSKKRVSWITLDQISSEFFYIRNYVFSENYKLIQFAQEDAEQPSIEGFKSFLQKKHKENIISLKKIREIFKWWSPSLTKLEAFYCCLVNRLSRFLFKTKHIEEYIKTKISSENQTVAFELIPVFVKALDDPDNFVKLV